MPDDPYIDMPLFEAAEEIGADQCVSCGTVVDDGDDYCPDCWDQLGYGE